MGSDVVLGISCDYHDAAAALLVGGRIVAAVEEERCSRRKHDPRLPEAAVRTCLEIADLTGVDVGEVVFHEKPLSLAGRWLTVKQRQGPAGFSSFLRDAPDLLGRNVFIGARIASMLNRLGQPDPPAVRFVDHHRSHAAAAFHPSPFDHAAVLTVDGLGEWATASIGVGSHHRIALLEETRFPHSIGLIYSLVTAWCGFRPNDDEYKLMGLAPYGTPTFADALATIVSVDDDGMLVVDGRAARWFSTSALRSRSLARLLGGPPRHPDAPVGEREADLAASVQDLLERAVLGMANRARRLTGERSLVLGGGVAHNSVANGRLVREGPFDRVWIQPAAGDAGSALGAALSRWHDELGHDRRVLGTDAMDGALLGPAPTDDDALDALRAAGVEPRVEPDLLARAEVAAGVLADGGVVGWFQGRAEFGPRALGSRSFLADPRDPRMRSRLNDSVKGRESFRPFAPAVLEEHAAEWFELDVESPYMLVVTSVRDDHLLPVETEPGTIAGRADVARSTIPACTHVDGSSRVQTVGARHADLRRVLEAFHRRTGCPVLVNTSFNRAGEPIVATPAQALHTAAAAGADLLVIGPALVDRAALRQVSGDGRAR